jgi:hypothetical protein
LSLFGVSDNNGPIIWGVSNVPLSWNDKDWCIGTPNYWKNTYISMVGGAMHGMCCLLVVVNSAT